MTFSRVVGGVLQGPDSTLERDVQRSEFPGACPPYLNWQRCCNMREHGFTGTRSPLEWLPESEEGKVPSHSPPSHVSRVDLPREQGRVAYSFPTAVDGVVGRRESRTDAGTARHVGLFEPISGVAGSRWPNRQRAGGHGQPGIPGEYTRTGARGDLVRSRTSVSPLHPGSGTAPGGRPLAQRVQMCPLR